MANQVNTDNVKQQMIQKRQQQQMQQGQGAQSPAAATSNSIASYLKQMGPAISNVLPKHMTPERMARIALSEIRKNPMLLQCEVASLGAAVMQAATLGLEPSVLGHCYFVPFNRKVQQGNRTTWVKDVQFIIGYRGYIDLARRSGELVTIKPEVVRENDEFSYNYGINDDLFHRPALKNRGAVTHYYAYAKFKDGGYTFSVMSREDVLEHAFKFTKQQKNNQLTGVWRDHFDSMAKKTVIREMIKYMPLSVEVLEKLGSDGQVVKGINEEELKAGDPAAAVFDMEIPADGEPVAEEEQQPAALEQTEELSPEELKAMEKDLAAAQQAQEQINQRKQQEKK